MSFSSVIKEELCRVEAPRECCTRAELAAVFCMNAAPIMAGAPDAVSQPPAAERDHIVTENAAFARRVFNLLRGLYRVSPDITIRKNRRLKKHAAYIVCAGAQSGPAHSPDADINKLRRLTRKTCCKKAALRGAFLAGGSVTDPEKLYHLEIFCKRPEAARFFAELMARFSLKPKITARGEYEIVYVKESESIVNFLNVTGAHRALMSLENIRIVKEMRNSVNRIVNCETANLEKTVNASLRQIANIMYIRRTIGFDALPPSLREIAELRVGNREIGLLELGQIANPPLGKSGVNHRLRKLDQIAEELRGANGRRAAPSLLQKNQTFSIRERP